MAFRRNVSEIHWRNKDLQGINIVRTVKRGSLNRKTSHIYGLEELLLLIWQYFSNCHVDMEQPNQDLLWFWCEVFLKVQTLKDQYPVVALPLNVTFGKRDQPAKARLVELVLAAESCPVSLNLFLSPSCELSGLCHMLRTVWCSVSSLAWV